MNSQIVLITGAKMGRKRGNRSNLVRTNAHLFAAVAAVFGRQNQVHREL
jgi:hypothetical protein